MLGVVDEATNRHQFHLRLKSLQQLLLVVEELLDLQLGMLATRDVGHRPDDAPRSSFSVPRHDDPAFLDPYVVAVFVPDAAFGQ